MSTEITRFIPLASRTSEQTDFPTIAFRSAARDLAKDTETDKRERKMSKAKALTSVRSLARQMAPDLDENTMPLLPFARRQTALA